MGASTLTYLSIISTAIISVLVVLVIYGNVLEDEEIHMNNTEERMMASGQPALIDKMNRLARTITVVAAMLGFSLLVSAAVWAWIGLYKS